MAANTPSRKFSNQYTSCTVLEIPEVQLSFWPLFFLIAGGQSWLISALLLTDKTRRRSQRYLAALMFCFGYMLMFDFAYWTNVMFHLPHVLFTLPAFNFLFGPLLLLYIASFRKTSRLHKWQLLHFIPALLVVVYMFPFYIQDGADKLQIMMGQMSFPWRILPRSQFAFLFRPWCFGGHMVIYLLWCIAEYRQLRLDARIKERPHGRIAWFVVVISAYSLFLLTYLLYFIISDEPFFRVTYDYMIAFVMTLSIYTIAYLGYRRPEVLSSGLLLSVLSQERYATSSLTDAAVESIKAALHLALTEQRLYRDSKLRLGDVARAIESRPHDLSRVINEHFGKSFNQYINNYRVEDAKALLRSEDHRDKQILEVAYEVGFNNKTTFNKAFKEICGCSPSEYRKQF